MANILSGHQQGTFPSTTEVNPNSAKTLRSGRKVSGPVQSSDNDKQESFITSKAIEDKKTEASIVSVPPPP